MFCCWKWWRPLPALSLRPCIRNISLLTVYCPLALTFKNCQREQSVCKVIPVLPVKSAKGLILVSFLLITWEYWTNILFIFVLFHFVSSHHFSNIYVPSQDINCLGSQINKLRFTITTISHIQKSNKHKIEKKTIIHFGGLGGQY